MIRISFFSTLFCLSIIVCHAQSSDDIKYEQACNYFEAKEYEKAFPILKELADNNHAKALNLLGVLYNHGYCVPKNMQKAVDFYQKSADWGWRRAQSNLGICYEEGEGVPQNMDKAYLWYEKAFHQYKELAEKGDADAQLEMGAIYYHGRIRSGKDYSKALPWLEKAANQGKGEAMNLLGLMYQYSYGVEKDVNKAYDYYLKGANNGNYFAQRNLAWLFQDEQFRELHSSGEGEAYHVDFDFDKQTEKWLRMAAQKEANFMYELARFYLDMQVLDEWQDKDPFMYLNKAAETGSGIAQACIGYENIIKGDYDGATNCFRFAKEKGIITFWTFDYAESEELSIDACLKILQYLKSNPELKLNYSRIFSEENYLLSVRKGEGNNALILLSKTGSIIAQTPFFQDIWVYENPENSPYPYISFNNNSSVNFLNKEIQFDVMDGIYRFTQHNPNLKIITAHYNGGEYIYIAVSNEKELYSYMKIDKTGKIIKSLPFVDNKIYVIYDEEKINLSYGENIYLNDSKINLDIIFAIFDFLFSSTDYRLDCWDALYVNNSYLLIHVQHRVGDIYQDYKWFKLSTTGKILGKTTTETDNSINYLFSNEKCFYYYDVKTEKNVKFDLQEMLRRIK